MQQLKFVFREAFFGLRRNMTMTIAMVITTALSLALLATGILITVVTNDTKDIYLNRVEVMVQFDDRISAEDQDCTSPECKAVFEKLRDNPEVESITFRNQDKSFEHFTQLFEATDPILVSNTDPKSLPAALHVKLVDPLNNSAIDSVRGMPGIIAIVDQNNDIRDAISNLDSIRNASFVIAAVQAIAAVFLIMNMVQIAAYSRRDEISIMRMVGASRFYTQAPFVLEAMIGALMGSILAIIGLFAGKNFVVDPALKSLYESHLLAPLTNTDIWLTAPVLIIVGMLVAALTAEVTLRFYVRK